MLFRPVCGHDLEEVCRLMKTFGDGGTNQDLSSWLIQRPIESNEATNLEEAYTVLRSAGICFGRDPLQLSLQDGQPLQLRFLQKLRALELGVEGGSHVLDSWYLRILREVFIEPDVLYANDLHRQANGLNPPVPLSDEKLNSWRRVLEWLGVGRRLGAGFVAVWSQDLIGMLLASWGRSEGPLQDFVEHVEMYLSVTRHDGDLSRALAQPLLCLESRGELEMSARQDSPGKSYLGHRRVKWIRRTGEAIR